MNKILSSFLNKVEQSNLLSFNEFNKLSVNKIVSANIENLNEIFTWGARPKVAQELVSKLKDNGFSKEKFNHKLHLWYGKNRGKELEKELVTLLNS